MAHYHYCNMGLLCFLLSFKDFIFFFYFCGHMFSEISDYLAIYQREAGIDFLCIQTGEVGWMVLSESELSAHFLNSGSFNVWHYIQNYMVGIFFVINV